MRKRKIRSRERTAGRVRRSIRRAMVPIRTLLETL